MNVDWLDAEPCVRKPVEKGRPPSDERLYVNGLSGVTSHMAREGISDAAEGWRDFWNKARGYHNARSNFTGLTFADYLVEKARAKARLYNTADRLFSSHSPASPVDDGMS